MVCGPRSRAIDFYCNLGALYFLFWYLFQIISALESKKMSNTTLLLLSVFVFFLMVIGLVLMVREFMGDVQDTFPEVKEWLDTKEDKPKK
jgi:hypothetical protein